MAAISDDWQARLTARDFLIGRGTNYPGLGAISGIGALDPQTSDMPGIGDGEHQGVDRYPARNILIPVTVLGDTMSAVWTNYRALAEAWRISRTTELELEVRVSGSARSFFGRPRGLPATLSGLKGAMTTTAAFRCGDPFAYGAEVDSGVDTASPMTIASATLGTEDTDRATVTIAGNGGTPVLTNSTTGGVLTFDTVLAGGQSYVINLHTRVVTRGGVAVPSEIDPASTWLDLAGGVANTITWTGCASVRIQYRPAWGTA
jgi:hypothetical protein